MHEDNNKNFAKQENENTEKLGEWTKEMLKSENLLGPFKTVEELMQSTWYSED